MCEKDIQKQIVEYLTLCGATVIRVNSGGIRAKNRDGTERYVRFNSQDGCSDLVVCIDGRFLAIEVKRPRKKPTANQVEFAERVRRSRGVAIVATSVDDLERQLREHGFETLT